ncbi:alpha/beta-hydrolase [Aspergillus saccharolyticus JOP 1030-1]|uniref:Alpha/beta-hydrolase n=1 Tax=Aspergillus saccharolyticus JOP 1030-1 TaxID=1450539 RepID=A0A318Z700_9EURO|nr:alpha/beta-hydrolase [Aspergillus saccharolyticus JOP 1030-1]PYH42906.1 alpha/beta-hydrolase [Aspergillus saccharolyticus JOP 1030-1]
MNRNAKNVEPQHLISPSSGHQTQTWVNLALLFLGLLSSGHQAQQDLPHCLRYFYVGGRIHDSTRGQRTPSHRADTGTNWRNKPDGQPGWAAYFLAQGYECYLLDQPFRGRSPRQSWNGEVDAYSTEHLQRYFTAPGRYALWPQAKRHTQWPGSGVIHDPIFDAYFASTVPFVNDSVIQETAMQKAGVALLDHIGTSVILLAHSQGGIMGWLLADQRPELVRMMVFLGPGGPPFRDVAFGNGSARAYGLTNIPIAYSPAVVELAVDLVTTTIPANQPDGVACLIQADTPPPRQLANLSKLPVMLVTSEASYHAQVRRVHEMRGNGHMMFLGANSDSIAALIQKKIEMIAEAETS